mmetsp:Transcript_4391/g.10182  ORF Transcript_4391/g.10182 Transcript_4391/m.10182 type:complete len:431 (+) Transcript_4391:195-1487(+)
MVSQVCQVSWILPNGLHKLLPVFWRAVLQRTSHDVAGYPVARQALDVSMNHIHDLVLLVQSPMLEHVLNDEVAEGMPAQLRRADQYLLDQRRRLLARAVLQQALQDPAAIAVSCCRNSMSDHLGQNEVEAVWRNELDALLKDVVRVGRGKSLLDMPLELLGKRYTLACISDFEGLLDHPCAARIAGHQPGGAAKKLHDLGACFDFVQLRNHLLAGLHLRIRHFLCLCTSHLGHCRLWQSHCRYLQLPDTWKCAKSWCPELSRRAGRGGFRRGGPQLPGPLRCRASQAGFLGRSFRDQRPWRHWQRRGGLGSAMTSDEPWEGWLPFFQLRFVCGGALGSLRVGCFQPPALLPAHRRAADTQSRRRGAIGCGLCSRGLRSVGGRAGSCLLRGLCDFGWSHVAHRKTCAEAAIACHENRWPYTGARRKNSTGI